MLCKGKQTLPLSQSPALAELCEEVLGQAGRRLQVRSYPESRVASCLYQRNVSETNLSSSVKRQPFG